MHFGVPCILSLFSSGLSFPNKTTKTRSPWLRWRDTLPFRRWCWATHPRSPQWGRWWLWATGPCPCDPLSLRFSCRRETHKWGRYKTKHVRSLYTSHRVQDQRSKSHSPHTEANNASKRIWLIGDKSVQCPCLYGKITWEANFPLFLLV